MSLRTECYLGSSQPQDSDSQLEANLESADPELCIRLLQVPTVVNYSGVRCRLEGSDQTWMFQFLELSGLDLLLEALDRFSDRGCSRFADPDLQLACINCVRAVMNSSAGIHFIVENEGYIRKLSEALDTSNTMVKKQVFELLVALSMYDYRLTLDALDHYKGVKTQQHRFSVIMNEMQATDNVPYMVTLLIVINALISGTDDLRERDKMRKEFIGLQLLDMLLKFSDKKDKDLIIQCEVFKEAKDEDEDELLRIYEDIDMGNHLEMLHLGPNHCDIWQGLEAQHSQMESSEEIMQRLLLFSKGKSEAGDDEVDGQLVTKTIQTDQMDGDKDRPARSTSTPPSTFPPPPPPPPLPGACPTRAGPTRAGRRPNKKMKKLNWQKIPTISDHSMWALVQKVPPPLDPDYSSMEELFCFPVKERKDKGAAAPVKKESNKNIIDDYKKNLTLNIFLKQFKCSSEDLVAMIQKGDRTKFDMEVLKELQKLLPDQQEKEKLKSFQGEKDKLANVDRFYISLLSVPCCELRIECMLMCEETNSVIEMFKPKVQLVEEACQSLRDSNLLSSFCRLILDVGNFLNYESQKKNAEGFKLISLLNLTETKANGSGITLLHHILEKAEQNHPKLLELQDDIKKCEAAAGVKLESIQSEASDSQKGPKEPSIKEIIRALLKRLEDTSKKVSNSTKDVTEQYKKVIEESMQACRNLEEKFLEIDKKKSELAVYLCEDADQLSLEELFGTLRTFRRRFIEALKENETRIKQAAKVEKRNKQLIGEESKRPKGDNRKIIKRDVLPQNDHIIDHLWAGLRKGVPLSVTRPRCDSERLPSSEKHRDTGPSDMDEEEGDEGILKEMEEEKAVPVEQEEATEEQGVVVRGEPSEPKGNDTAVGNSGDGRSCVLQ